MIGDASEKCSFVMHVAAGALVHAVVVYFREPLLFVPLAMLSITALVRYLRHSEELVVYDARAALAMHLDAEGVEQMEDEEVLEQAATFFSRSFGVRCSVKELDEHVPGEEVDLEALRAGEATLGGERVARLTVRLWRESSTTIAQAVAGNLPSVLSSLVIVLALREGQAPVFGGWA